MIFTDTAHDLDSSLDAWEGLYRKVYAFRYYDQISYDPSLWVSHPIHIDYLLDTTATGQV